jgi:hypothetical protein
MKFVCYTDWCELPASVDQLFRSNEKESLFFSKTWFENLLDHGLDGNQKLLLLCVVEKERVLALLPLVEQGDKHGYPLKHLYTSLYTLLIDENRQQQILNCLIEGLRRVPVRSLQLEPTAEDDAGLLNLQQIMKSNGFSCHRYFSFYNWFHPTKGQSFSDYMASRPSRVRNTVSRKQRKLEREQNHRIQLFTERHIDQALSDYRTVYNASWKANEVFEPFIEGLAKQLAKQGWLRLAILYIDNQPAAAQFWFVVHGKASIFKLAYDEAWKRYSPGTILLVYLMEQVIDKERVEEIDFLTGNDAYKQDWMSQRRQRWRLCCIDNNPLSERRMHLANRLWKQLKSRLDKVYNG